MRVVMVSTVVTPRDTLAGVAKGGEAVALESIIVLKGNCIM